MGGHAAVAGVEARLCAGEVQQFLAELSEIRQLDRGNQRRR
jgi:hypothetical protein